MQIVSVKYRLIFRGKRVQMKNISVTQYRDIRIIDDGNLYSICVLHIFMLTIFYFKQSLIQSCGKKLT